MRRPKTVESRVVAGGDELPLFYRLSFRRGRISKLLLGLACVAVVGFLAWNYYNTQLDKRRQQVEAANNQINSAILQGNYGQAINQAKTSNKSDEQTQLLLISAYMNKGDYKSAVAAYQDVIRRYGANLGLVDGAAQAAEQAGEYSQAIAYYSQARQLVTMSKNYPTKQADMAEYDAKIKALQAKL